ncbi:Fe(3+)-hydroxamate ABC transporter permease FhuB [Bosea sp. MMO-172]|uniref:Fe(3+)-hydroxamate ABC transporter permease FhuB n=1 Tax=Bosea sp. MMO-172 TaxID=3127885 RepID=UPI00301738CA
MAEVASVSRPALRPHPWLLAVLLLVLAGANTEILLSRQASSAHWLAALLQPQEAAIGDLLIAYSLAPRAAMALLCGAALGLSGSIFQTVLRNPLAEPSTLGVSAGASLALVSATLWLPEWLAWGQEAIALAGGGLGCLSAFLIARRQGMAPAALIMAGLVVSLYCGSLAALAVLYNQDNLTNLFIWQSGALFQSGWSGVHYLLPRVLLGAILAFAALRPLALLELGDQTATASGLKVGQVRAGILVIAVALGCFVVSAVGMISFIGLAAPNLARFCGARTARQRLVWAPLIGAGLLWSADSLVQLLGLVMRELPTGTATALLGAPCLLILLVHSRQRILPAVSEAGLPRASRTGAGLLGLVILLAVAVGVALFIGRGPDGWEITLPFADAHAVLQWRWPRALGALAAGGLLAIAGTALQRLTANPMASPEVLGLTSGAALGFMVQIMLLPAQAAGAGLAGAGIGAALTLAALLLIGSRAHGGPERSLLVGICLATLCSAVVTVLLSTGHPALRGLLGWLSGSTAGVTPQAALGALAALLGALLILPALLRWLAILPLGLATAGAVGVSVRPARALILTYCAVATAAATLLIGPLGFVGLMAPHIARRFGFTAPGSQFLGAVLVGAALLVVSDWIGRVAIFPWEIPAGLVSAFVGGPYFIWLMQRRGP